MSEEESYLWRGIKNKFNFKLEVHTQLFLVSSIAICFGIMESLFIDTAPFNLVLFGKWSYYHVGLMFLIIVGSFAMSISNIQRMVRDRKRYMLLMGIGSVPYGLMLEDITWFAARWQPIAKNDWTMFKDGWGIYLGFTWIPFWYIVVITFTLMMFSWANECAKRGYEAYIIRREYEHNVRKVAMSPI